MSTAESKDAGASAASRSQPATVEEAQAEIERTREHLGETVDALAAKADVKAQAQRKVAEVKDRVHATASSLGDRVSDVSPSGNGPDIAEVVGRIGREVRRRPFHATVVALTLGFYLGRLSKPRKRR